MAKRFPHCPDEEGVYCTRVECPCVVLGKPPQEMTGPRPVTVTRDKDGKMRYHHRFKVDGERK